MRTVFALGLAVSVAAFGAGCSSARVTQPLPIGADTYTVSAPRRTAARHPQETLPSPQRTNNARVFLGSCWF